MTLSRLLVAPAALAGNPEPITLLAARAAAWRRAADPDPAGVELLVGTLEGDLASQHAVERELAREGLDRAVVGRDAFVERVKETEARRRIELAAALAEAGIELDVEAGRTGSESGALAARIAFVRLFDAGLLERIERVVDVCPRCETVVEPRDAHRAPTDVERVVLVLDDVGGGPSLQAALVELELLPGAVAVAVPPGHDAAGTTVRMPLGRNVPVVIDDATSEPWIVIPAHDDRGLAVARRINAAPLTVLDGDGVVRVDGALDGLARFAARAAAAEMVAAEGAVISRETSTADIARCGRCATPLVPLLGWHWFLRVADLEVAAADAVREGVVVMEDGEARDRFAGRAERAASWCLSHQVWAGEAVPAARCADCGQVAVTVETSTSCGKCMGELVSTDDVLDARFVAAVWPIAVAGWPADERAPAQGAAGTVAFAGLDDVVGWALPVAALGLRLAGAVPFGELVVVRVEESSGEVPV